jgi:hypothetical protein
MTLTLGRQESHSTKKNSPNELIPQMTPWTKILCSYKAINAPAAGQSGIHLSVNAPPTQRRRSQKREHDGIARSIALKHLALDQNLRSAAPQLLPDLFFRFSKGKSLRLREEVGQQDAVVLGGEGIVCVRRGNEVSGNELGALMNQLIEGVLTVRASCTPDDRLGKGFCISIAPNLILNVILTPVS